MQVTLKKAFSLLDGRLSTDMNDVKEMLNFIFSDNLYTDKLPTAMEKLRKINPRWLSDGIEKLNGIKAKYQTVEFEELMDIIDRYYPDTMIEMEKLYS